MDIEYTAVLPWISLPHSERWVCSSHFVGHLLSKQNYLTHKSLCSSVHGYKIVTFQSSAFLQMLCSCFLLQVNRMS